MTRIKDASAFSLSIFASVFVPSPLHFRHYNAIFQWLPDLLSTEQLLVLSKVCIQWRSEHRGRKGKGQSPGNDDQDQRCWSLFTFTTVFVLPHEWYIFSELVVLVLFLLSGFRTKP